MRRIPRMRPAGVFGYDGFHPDTLAVLQGLLKSGLYSSRTLDRSKARSGSDAPHRDDWGILPEKWQWPGTDAERGTV